MTVYDFDIFKSFSDIVDTILEASEDEYEILCEIIRHRTSSPFYTSKELLEEIILRNDNRLSGFFFSLAMNICDKDPGFIKEIVEKVDNDSYLGDFFYFDRSISLLFNTVENVENYISSLINRKKINALNRIFQKDLTKYPNLSRDAYINLFKQYCELCKEIGNQEYIEFSKNKAKYMQEVLFRENIELPVKGYKKCRNGVIVETLIPEDAIVRGNPNDKCRSNKAIITKVDGTIFGEKVGISLYDFSTCYREGETVIIEDFDLSHDKCSTGFHFFLTREKAESYNEY